MPLTKLYQTVKDSVVRVVALSGSNVASSGSGSVIDDGHKVLTCEHCLVQGCQPAIVDPKDPTKAIFATVVFSDKTADIAVLQLPKPIGTPVTFASSAGVAPGNGAFVVGFPLGIEEKTLLSAHVASTTNAYVRIDASVNHGNSGGPLFALSGHQIGVVNAKHGSLSTFLDHIKTAQPMAMISIGGVDPVKAIQALITEMERNLNLGIGYAIPTDKIKGLHAVLKKCIP